MPTSQLARLPFLKHWRCRLPINRFDKNKNNRLAIYVENLVIFHTFMGKIFWPNLAG
jgi:hypothetical protein